MDRAKLNNLFEQMLTEPPEAGDTASVATRAELAAAVMQPDFDGLADIYEREAGEDFLERVSAANLRVPPELVAAALAYLVPQARSSTTIAASVWRLPRSRRWVWAGAAASLLLAVFAARMGESLFGSFNAPAPVAKISGEQNAIHDMPSSSTAARIGGKNFNAAVPPPPLPRRPAVTRSEPVYTAPNPPQALSIHAVTADDYPPASVRLQEQGTVVGKYLIGTDGAVSACEVTGSSGFPRLDEAACVMVRKWTFKPASVLDGTPIAIWMPVQIVFQLKGSPPPPPGVGDDHVQRDDLVRRRVRP